MAIKDGTYTTTINRGGFLNRRTTTLNRTYKDGMLIDQSSVTRSNGDVFSLVFMLLLIAAMITVLSGGSEQKTFYSFLKMMENIPAVDLSFIRDGLTGLLADTSGTIIVPVLGEMPTFFSWIGEGWNTFVGVLNFITFIIQGAIYILQFAWSLLGWLFA